MFHRSSARSYGKFGEISFRYIRCNSYQLYANFPFCVTPFLLYIYINKCSGIIRLISLWAFIGFVINHCFFLCYYVIKIVGILHFLDIVMREFLVGLKTKPCDEVNMTTDTGFEHWYDLVADPHRKGLGYWSLSINLVQWWLWQYPKWFKCTT